MNISELIKKIEMYNFEQEGGLLVNCSEWIELKEEILEEYETKLLEEYETKLAKEEINAFYALWEEEIK
ncbi:MAG: hypothetical protein EPN88_13830 [Bacteroidetes bacterium]|nr:MAG: hypothetical protein EPN88_13830 [Bacteroidota bacterium]